MPIYRLDFRDADNIVCKIVDLDLSDDAAAILAAAGYEYVGPIEVWRVGRLVKKIESKRTVS